MKQRRVGTLTMGVVLVILGSLLILANLKGNAAIIFILKGWPLILILLGGEVLWFSHSSQGEKCKFVYDIFSIFIIGVICFTSLGIYSLTEIGIISRVNAMVYNQSFMLNTAIQECPIDESVKKLIIEAPKCNIKVRTGSENKVAIYGKAYVEAESRKRAEELLKAYTDAVYRKQGDVLYISFNMPISGRDVRLDQYNLILPENLAVEIDNASYRAEVQLDESSNVKVLAIVRDREDLAGNANWEVTEEGSPREDSNENPNQNSNNIRGKVTYGTGKYQINIISRGKVVLNQF